MKTDKLNDKISILANTIILRLCPLNLQLHGILIFTCVQMFAVFLQPTNRKEDIIMFS